MRNTSLENPITAECLFGKSINCKVLVPITNYKVLDPKTHQLKCKWIAVGFLEEAFRSWWVIGKSTLQLVGFPYKHIAVTVDFPDEHFAVGGFLSNLTLTVTVVLECCNKVRDNS